MSVRFGVRPSRNTFVSIGPVGALALSPFLLIFAMLYLYGAIIVGIYRGARALAHWAATR